MRAGACRAAESAWSAGLAEFVLCPAAMPTGVVSVDVVVKAPASLNEMAFASSSDTGVAVTRHYAMDQTVPITAQADSNKITPCDHAVLQARAFPAAGIGDDDVFVRQHHRISTRPSAVGEKDVEQGEQIAQAEDEERRRIQHALTVWQL